MAIRLLISTCILCTVTGCAVYVPTVPSTPLLRNKGEVEATAAIRSFSSFEAGAAWSPAGRLLLAAEGATQSSQGSETRNNVTTNYRNTHRQVGLGVGTYRLLGPDQSVYLGALGGMGYAKARVYDNNIESFYLVIPLFGPLVEYKANYLRYYGQLYVAKQRERVSYGFSVRGTVVSYTHLLRDNTSIQPVNRFFLEPTGFVRVGQGPIQGMATIGLSLPGRSDRQNPDRPQLAPSSSLISLGVVVRPHLLRQPQGSVVPN
ncbi:hypothetical protein J0X19_06375 [Hymenobacter sp. BT186]|uniref:Outer membrane protein beta-barrel domain-containing protein n=1 Tax=Hymenobacter telluris TaxID=2816474 RepID=A0A939JBR2_9BACT|nr:hypothetical protein [Hymenobacter telluris]MBO0357565.1 hypothetical protein [Hymenobacter telluris]MBW3373591.1 hypothetical protein [Hymenobacter norwichensis]